MSDLQLDQATIVYEDPEEGVTEKTVDNEALVYLRDHWMVHTGTDEDGNDQMAQIPRDRVHRVDRTVETFEEEARTVRRRVESLARDLRERIPVTGGDSDGEQSEPQPITIESDDDR